MQKFRFGAFCLFLTVFYSCNNAPKSDSQNETTASPKEATTQVQQGPAAENPSLREFNTSTGKTLVVEETHPVGASISNISVYFKKDTATKITLTDKDPVSTVLTADLDKNGFDELYVVTTAVGSGSYGNIYGFNSNKDLSLSFIYMPEITEKDLEPKGRFSGYEGHDAYTIEDKQLIRAFRINGKEGLSGKIIYSLKPTETGFQLTPVK